MWRLWGRRGRRPAGKSRARRSRSREPWSQRESLLVMWADSKYRAIGASAMAVVAVFGVCGGRAGGADHSAASMVDMPGPLSAGAGETQRAQERGRREGQFESALARLEAEARKGVFSAQMRLARIYSQGRGTPRNDAKAFLYYRQVADQNADIDIYHPAAKYVAEAFRALAGYYRSGVPALNLAPDRVREGQLLQQGASYFQDPIAQFRLARMYLKGDGVTRNATIGVRWLVNASRKRYAPAQAVLGDLLWDGKVVKSSPGEGLALLALAKDNAAPKDARWIAALCDKAMAEANESQIKIAQEVLARFEKLYRLKAGDALRIVRPGKPAPDSLNAQTKTLKAGALLGLIGREGIPPMAAGHSASVPRESDHLPIIRPLKDNGGGPGSSSREMLTGFAPQAGDAAPASAAAEEE
jgi:TPR repeat protein